jgi:hypothetical protein
MLPNTCIAYLVGVKISTSNGARVHNYLLTYFLSCKANARVKLAKTWHGPHSSTLVVSCVVWLLFVLFYVLFVCKCVLPSGDNPIAVNKYIDIWICMYKLEGRGIDSRWFHWNFSLT